jgi:hypothetical protein
MKSELDLMISEIESNNNNEREFEFHVYGEKDQSIMNMRSKMRNFHDFTIIVFLFPLMIVIL